MGKHVCIVLVILLLLACGTIAACASGSADQGNMADFWAPVEKTLGVKGELHPDGSITLDVPRNLSVTLNGITLAPGSDLSHEIRMQRNDDKAMVVGELVLKDNEIGNVTQRLRTAGISETALHNHLLHESPQLMYLHFHAYGDPVDISTKLNSVVTSLGKGPEGKFDNRSLDTAALDRIMGAAGKGDGGVYGYSIPRADNVTMDGMALSPFMDISTEITFQPLGGGKALAIGEYVIDASEVEPVIGALADNGFEADALHSHMLTEQPRLLYLHCWATGDADQLARGMKEALDRTNSLT